MLNFGGVIFHLKSPSRLKDLISSHMGTFIQRGTKASKFFHLDTMVKMNGWNWKPKICAKELFQGKSSENHLNSMTLGSMMLTFWGVCVMSTVALECSKKVKKYHCTKWHQLARMLGIHARLGNGPRPSNWQSSYQQWVKGVKDSDLGGRGGENGTSKKK